MNKESKKWLSRFIGLLTICIMCIFLYSVEIALLITIMYILYYFTLDHIMYNKKLLTMNLRASSYILENQLKKRTKKRGKK